MEFNKVIFMTDLDGTLLTDDKRILDKDMAAIERFRAGGGIFTAATGRGYAMARRVAVDKLRLDSLNIPAVLFNGAGVYDFKRDKFLWRCEVGAFARKYIREIINRFCDIHSITDIGLEILHEREVYVPFINETERMHLEMESVEPVYTLMDKIPEGGWMKFLFAGTPEVLDEVEKIARCGDFPDVQWVRSQPIFFEGLPKGVDKSRGFAELIKLVGAEERFSVAAGDYLNDKTMIENADLGAAVANAHPDVRATADIVVCDNNSGAISEIIDYIEKL